MGIFLLGIYISFGCSVSSAFSVAKKFGLISILCKKNTTVLGDVYLLPESVHLSSARQNYITPPISELYMYTVENWPQMPICLSKFLPSGIWRPILISSFSVFSNTWFLFLFRLSSWHPTSYSILKPAYCYYYTSKYDNSKFSFEEKRVVSFLRLKLLPLSSGKDRILNICVPLVTAISHMYPVDAWNVINATEELNFKFYFLLTGFKYK